MRKPGFTLIELIISIALVLILILGINQVFKIASDTVNAGQSQSSANRYNRAIQGVLYPDFQNAVVTQAPCFIIRSSYVPAFRNRADELADRDGNPLTVDNDGNNKETDPIDKIPATAVHSRNHRLDELIFFASGRFQRQTSGGASLSGSGSSNEAMIYYGHLRLPSNRLTTTADKSPVVFYRAGDPDAPTPRPAGWQNGDKNDNNKYATQWVLGRSVTLLGGDKMGNEVPPRTDFITAYPQNPKLVKPLDATSTSPGGVKLEDSVYDVAETSISGFREIVNSYSGTVPFSELVAGNGFDADLRPVRPILPAKMARTVPAFVEGCTQFIVEYAGDFLAQDTNPVLPTGAANPNYGKITGHAFQSTPLTDGVTDFVVVKTANGGVRKTRWYGMPRNVDNVLAITGGKGAGTNPNALVDVVPLRDVIASFAANSPPPNIEPLIDDAKLLPMAADYTTIAPGARYVAAWGPGDLSRGSPKRPTMIRITLVVDDPSGRMTEGQSYEYVFDLR